MAKFRTGPAVSSVSGSVGGITFARNRYGQYFRSRVKPVSPDSIYTIETKAMFRACSQSWANLTAAQRDAWKTWASTNPVTDSLGDKQVLAANAAYMKLNGRLEHSGDTLIQLPPTVAQPDALDTLTFTADIGAGTFQIAYTPTPLAAGQRLWVRGCVVNSPAVNYVRNLWKLLTVSAKALASPLALDTLFEDRFGTLQAGQVCYVSAAILDSATGLLSAPVVRQATIVST